MGRMGNILQYLVRVFDYVLIPMREMKCMMRVSYHLNGIPIKVVYYALRILYDVCYIWVSIVQGLEEVST